MRRQTLPVMFPESAKLVSYSPELGGQIAEFARTAYRRSADHTSAVDSSKSLLNELLLKDQWRAANSVGYEEDRHLNAVGNLNKGNATIHAVLFSVKGHCPGNLPVACPFA